MLKRKVRAVCCVCYREYNDLDELLTENHSSGKDTSNPENLEYYWKQRVSDIDE